MIGFIIIINVLIRIGQRSTYSFHGDEKTIPKPQVKLLLNKDSTLSFDSFVFTHQRYWNPSTSNKEQRLAYQVRLSRARKESIFRAHKLMMHYFMRRITEGDSSTALGIVYRELDSRFRGNIAHLADSLKLIGSKNELNRFELADLVVSFVQDFPYWYVLGKESCTSPDFKGHPCIDDIEFGLLSPGEVAFLAAGDCDSKALLIFSLLKHLGYEPLIVTSDEYAHAMLALNIPSGGDFLLYKGVRFYFWETTASGWQPGMLPPETGNKNYWEIALTYED